MTRIYLDYNSTTPVCPEALEVYSAAARECGNASSIHLDGQSARHRLEAAREGLAKLWGVKPQEIVFTSGATEANNLAVKGIARHAAQTAGKKHLLLSAAEHSSVLDAARALKPEGFEVEIFAVGRDGRVGEEAFKKRLRPDTALAAVMAVNNETGVIQPMDGIARICAEKNVPLHCDWVQGLGKLPVALEGCSTASFSAHKAYGPKGVGALFIARKTKLQALMHGGPQENNVRAGTESPELALAMLAAVRTAESRRASDAARYAECKAAFLQELKSALTGWTPTVTPESAVPQTIHLLVDGVDGNALVTAMDLAGFSLSSGSACAAGSVEPSHVMKAMGLDPERARGAVRISFGHFSKKEDLTLCARALAKETLRLRSAQ